MGRLPVIAVFDTNLVIDALSGVGAANVEDIRYERLLLSLLCDTAVL
jgi:hypothetical protein